MAMVTGNEAFVVDWLVTDFNHLPLTAVGSSPRRAINLYTRKLSIWLAECRWSYPHACPCMIIVL